MKTDYTGSLKNTLLDLGTQNTGSVLDIGCGNGEYTSILSQKVKHTVGIDPDEKSVRLAQQNCKYENSSFQVGRGEVLDFSSNSFDLVVFCQSLHHVARQTTLWEKGEIECWIKYTVPRTRA